MNIDFLNRQIARLVRARNETHFNMTEWQRLLPEEYLLRDALDGDAEASRKAQAEIYRRSKLHRLLGTEDYQLLRLEDLYPIASDDQFTALRARCQEPISKTDIPF